MSSFYRIVVAAPIFGLMVYCLAQIAIARIYGGRSPYRSLTLGFIAGFITTAGIATWAVAAMPISDRDSIGLVTLDVLSYLALAFGYFNFVNLTIASLRIRLLEELDGSGGVMRRADLINRHSAENVTAIRLERLIQGGHLLERNGRLVSGRLVFLAVARIFEGLRWAILGARKPRS